MHEMMKNKQANTQTTKIVKQIFVVFSIGLFIAMNCRHPVSVTCDRAGYGFINFALILPIKTAIASYVVPLLSSQRGFLSIFFSVFC